MIGGDPVEPAGAARRRLWALVAMCLVATGCRGGPAAVDAAVAVRRWQASPPTYAAPRLVVAGCTVTRFERYKPLTSWKHSRELLAAVCRQWLGVPEERVFVVDEPDRAAMERFFGERLAGAVGPEDILLLYLGTHQLEDGRLLLAGGESFRAPDLARWLQGVGAGRTVLLADICFGSRLEEAASFGGNVVRIYASGDDEAAPDVPVNDPGLRNIAAFFAETTALARADLGVSHGRYSLLGIIAAQALRREIEARPEGVSVERVWERMAAERDRLDPRVRWIPFPAFERRNPRDWHLANLQPPAPGKQVLPTIDALLKLHAEQVDVGLGNLVLGQVYDEQVNVAAYMRRLDAMAADIRERLRGERRPPAVVAIINRYLYEEVGIRAVDEPYPTDFLLHELLDRRRGRCSSLTTLYVALGRRLGIPFRAVCVPEHVFVRWVRQPDSPWAWEKEATGLNVETTLGGRALSDDDYRRRQPWEETAQSRQFYLVPLTARQTLGILCSPLASAMLHQGRVEEAAEMARTAVEVNPFDPEAWNNLGLARRRQDKIALAAACYRQALQIHPRFAEVWNNLGTIETDVDKRIRYFRQAVALKPGLADAWKNLAYAHYGKGDYREAMQCVKRCEELNYPLPAPFVEAIQRRQ